MPAIDVEGLDGAPGCLWLVGSHSRTRKRVDPDDDDENVAKALRTVRSRPNRNVLVRVPLSDGDDGLPVNGFGTMWRYVTAKDDRPAWPGRVLVTPAKPPARVDGERMLVTWVGHATVLVQTNGINILTVQTQKRL